MPKIEVFDYQDYSLNAQRIETVRVTEGAGKLVITHLNGTQSIHEVDETAFGFCHLVEVGELMQWQAASDSELVVFEICFPPYQVGRFENIAE